MYYHLITGATGLLGGYLLRDLIDADVSLAVLARGTDENSGYRRIDDILSHWERLAGFSLPRPIVLNGDLTKYHLGLNDVDVQWVRDHCMAVIHNAASLSFTGNDRNAEPWVSNLNGTRNVLELCRSTGIRRFYHVSTAYICGDRRGEVYENEMDVGQQTSNDYEASKLAAEQAVRSAEWLNHVTVFRPSIIAGDSRTGFTSTFHGFYFPLKIAMNLSRLGAFSKLFDLKELLSTMGLDGTERKNFVPVDWVSSVIAKAVTSPELQGQTII